MYAVGSAGFFLTFTIAAFIVNFGMSASTEANVLQAIADFRDISFYFAVAAFFGGAFAESAAGKMGRF